MSEVRSAHKVKRCYGWPSGTTCDNPPGCRHTPYWCFDCNQKRMAHINASFQRLADPFKESEV